jgi:hypothetical protein
MAMSVSRLREQIPTNGEPSPAQATALPPFWELEDLIASGLDHDAALAVMAARRVELRLVGAGETAGTEQAAFSWHFDLPI